MGGGDPGVRQVGYLVSVGPDEAPHLRRNVAIIDHERVG